MTEAAPLISPMRIALPRPAHALAVLGAWVALFAAWTWIHPAGRLATEMAEGAALTLAGLVAAACCTFAASTFTGRRRWAWGLGAGAFGSYVLGNLAFTYYQLFVGVEQPLPSPADAFHLAAVLLAAAAIALLPAPRRRYLLIAQALVDGAIVAGVLLWISWAFVIQPLAAQGARGALALAVATAYPIGDVILVAAAAYAATYSSREVRPIVLTLGAGLLCLAVADSSLAYATAAGLYHRGSPIDTGWAAGLGLVAVAAVLAARRPWPQPILDARPVAASTVVYTVVAAGILGRILAGGRQPLVGVLYWDAVVIALLVVVRQVLVVLDNWSLTRERGRALAALRESESRLDQLLSVAPVVIFAFDRAGTLQLARGSGVPGVERLAGESIHEFESEPARALVTAALAGEESAGAVPLPDDRVLEVRCSPVVEDGEVVGAVGVGLDITDRLKAVAARRESEAKDKFLANMSHELRTPLNSILGFAQMLERDESGPLNERQRRYQRHILASGLQLLDLINDLLDLSKIRAGGLDVDVQPLNVAPVIREAVDSVRPQVEAGGLTLELGAVDGVAVEADPRRLKQVLLNVLANAVKFTPAGGKIRVDAARSRRQVSIDVADTGIGIAEGDQERIFDEFTQVDVGRNRPAQGTGLGLTLSRALARRMGGDLVVSSCIGSGSTFSVLLPSAGGDLPDEVAEAAQPLA